MNKKYSEHHLGSVSAQLWKCDAYDLLSGLSPASVDLIVTSPPYFMGKDYDTSTSPGDFTQEIRRVLPALIRSIKRGGSLCWQVGNHVQDGRLIPLDLLVANAMARTTRFTLRNRIIWTFGHGMHATKRFSGRHETILWYTKGDDHYFNLDAVRIAQTYPGKRHYKGPKKGDWSGNPLGKNPGDVWEVGDIWNIPNVKANHVEKTDHPCQFPTSLIRRLATAFSPKGGLVVDPYVGSGTSAIAALLEARNFIGSDLEKNYLDIAKARITSLEGGNLKVRQDVPVYVPAQHDAVAVAPPHFRFLKEATNG